MGADLVRAINHSARTSCGYATVIEETNIP